MLVDTTISQDGSRVITSSSDIKVLDLEKQRIIASYNADYPLYPIAAAPDGMTIVAFDTHLQIHILRLENIFTYLPIVTPWQLPSPLWKQFWHRNEKRPMAFGCPLCRTWSEIPASALGTEIPCPHCGKPIKLNPFTINADWRPVANAWGMKDIPGDKEMSDRSRVNTSIQKKEETESINTEKVEEKIKSPGGSYCNNDISK